jgi:hypothetical protein
MQDEKWVTINGTHVLIKPGQTKAEAIKEFTDKQEERKKLQAKSIDELRAEASTTASTDEPKVTEHRSLEAKKDVDDFFFYDDERRGLLAKRNSSYGKWERNLTPHQRYVISDYTSDGYSNINSYLRGYDNGEKYSIDYVKGEIVALDKAIADFELREPIITYRSINSDAFWENLNDITSLIGTEYSDPAFMSTSPTKDSGALNKDLLMTIKLPKGKGIGAYIDQYNGLKEKEFLLARGSRFKITNAHASNGKYYLEMELIK